MSASVQSVDPAGPATSVESIPGVVAATRAVFEDGRTRSLDWRRRQLQGLGRFFVEREAEIAEALAADLGKPYFEAFGTEIGFLSGEVHLALKNLSKWTKPKRVPTSLIAQPGVSKRYPEPLGVCLVISPWNYPFQLLMGPTIGALAAGNCVVLKPSEVAPAVSALVTRRVPEYVDADAVRIVEGGVAETTALLEQRFDHIFYTGNGTVGRIVMTAAAKHLTPVVLELGGKSPCIVDASVDLEVAAKRIAMGKWVNAGQTCVAPDYVLAHESIHDRLVDRLKAAITDFYGADPKQSPDFARIVNARHHRRVARLIDSGKVAAGGQVDEAERYIAPTILTEVSPDSPVMQEEIFGPVLPILKVRSVDEAIRFVRGRDKPLALYVFTRDKAVSERVLAQTSSGGATVNHVWLHLGVPDLPFGGVGPSGMGVSHGKAGFEMFTHYKSVLHKPTFLDPPVAYPPYDEGKLRLLRRLL